MEKKDLTKLFMPYYSAKSNPSVNTFGKINYLTVTGSGEPGGKDFVEKTQSLYSVAYGIKKYFKQMGNDFSVPKLEGLWWAKGSKPFLSVPREQWQWKLLIRMPEDISQEIIRIAIEEVITKKKNILANNVKLEIIDEGKTVSILHIGPYSTEAASIDKLSHFMQTEGLKKNGEHHEIYLSDPNKTAQEKMKTILRQPVK